MKNNLSCKIAEDMDQAIQSKDYQSLLTQIENLWDEKLRTKKFYIKLLQEVIEQNGITAEHIVGWALIHGRPHGIFNCPVGVIRSVEGNIGY